MLRCAYSNIQWHIGDACTHALRIIYFVPRQYDFWHAQTCSSFLGNINVEPVHAFYNQMVKRLKIEVKKEYK